MRSSRFVRHGAFVAAALVLLLPSCSKKRRAPDLRNLPVAEGDASLVETSPFAGEESVALSRETILRFSTPIDPASVHDGDVTVDASGVRVPVRLHLGRDGKSLTLFWAQGRGPAGTEVAVTVNGDALASAQTGRPLDADGDGFTGGLAQFTFKTLDLARVPGTDVCGRVFASEVDGDRSVPLQGVTIRVDGLETEAFTTTDFLGSFCLRDVPAGRIFVHVDGSTATNRLPGFYYPNVGKAWETVAGQRVNAGTVHLPAVAESTLQPVAQDRAVEIRMVDEQLARVLDPDLRARLANVALTVPADSLFADDGRRGGRVGIAPVAPDRLPGTLPPGLDLPLVITVQTDGASNFDLPAPICLPNLPDPRTGLRLPAGAKSALWSFNHDTGRFEVVGPMTVTADGSMVCTDPGVGIRAPGWHGSAPGSGADGGPPGAGDDGGCDDCCKKSWWDITKAVYAVAGELAECAVDMFKIRRAFECLLAWKNFIGALLDQADTFVNLLESQGTSIDRATAIAMLNDLIAKKNRAIEMQACFETVDPTAKVSAAITCAKSALRSVKALCDLAGKCQIVVGQDFACSIVRKAEAVLTELEGFAGLFESWKERAFTQLVCQAIERATALIRRYLEPERDLTQAQVDEMIAALRGIRPLTPDAFAVLPYFDRLATAEAPAKETARDMSRIAGTAVRTVGTRHARRVRFALTVGDRALARRGETTTSGTLSVITPGDAPYQLAMFDPTTRLYGFSTGTTSASGQRTTLHPPALFPIDGMPDADSDGLPDDVEFVVDTDPALADTDDDGVNDGDEVFAGRDPLDGIGGRAGVRSTTDTAGPAIDLCAADGLAAVALGATGVELFNIYNGMTPERVGRVDTPGAALRVACARTHVAVADGSEGLTLLDVTVPENARVAHRLALGDVRVVTVAGGVVWAGTAGGRVSLVEITQGVELGSVGVGPAIVDVQVRGDVGYALSDNAVHVLRRRGLVLEVASTVAVGRSGCVRLFAGDDTLVATHWRGFVALDLAANPLAPRVLAATDTSQRGWRHLVLDGSGYGLGVVGLNSGPDASDDLHVYDLRDPRAPGTFVRDFSSDGLGEAIPAAVVSYDGLAYLADRRGKLIVVRYLRRDLGHTRPELTFGTSLPEPRIEEGKVLALRARVRDDVQAQYVDFYVGDERVATDASYPFEHVLTAPARAQAPQLRVWARAWDTGGNDTVAETIAIEVHADTTAPEVIGRIPAASGVAVAGVDQTVTVTFSEPLAAYTVQADALTVVHAGPDGALGTADDVPLRVREVVFQPELQLAIWALADAMPPGAMRATLGASLRDAAGNALVPVTWDFTAHTGLVMTMYQAWSAQDLETFFATRTPETFTVYRSGMAGEPRTATVVPNIHFNAGSGAWLTHAGANGLWETGNFATPGGDDITFVSPNGSDSFAWVVRGTLDLPQAGDFTFQVDIDDQFVLEIDGQRIMGVPTGCRVSSIGSGRIPLTAGAHRIRMAMADWCSCCALGQLQGWGPGLPGGIIPAARFGR